MHLPLPRGSNFQVGRVSESRVISTGSFHLQVDVQLSEVGLVRKQHVPLHEEVPSQHHLRQSRVHSGRKFKRSPIGLSLAGPSRRVLLGEAAV